MDNHKIDFKSYDAQTRWHYPADLRKRVADLGYRYISEMIAGEYNRLGGRRAAAKSIGVSGHTIWRHMRLMGFPPRPRGGANNHCKWATPEIDTKIKLMDSRGFGYRAIAAVLGRAMWQIRRRMMRLGLIPKKPYRRHTKGGHILDKGCPICGSALTEIRGAYPGETRRKVCATCLQEKLEIIHEETSPDYCIADQKRSI